MEHSNRVYKGKSSNTLQEDGSVSPFRYPYYHSQLHYPPSGKKIATVTGEQDFNYEIKEKNAEREEEEQQEYNEDLYSTIHNASGVNVVHLGGVKRKQKEQKKMEKFQKERNKRRNDLATNQQSEKEMIFSPPRNLPSTSEVIISSPSREKLSGTVNHVRKNEDEETVPAEPALLRTLYAEVVRVVTFRESLLVDLRSVVSQWPEDYSERAGKSAKRKMKKNAEHIPISSDDCLKPQALRLLKNISRDLREAGLRCVERIVAWVLAVDPHALEPSPFLWNGQDYLYKMHTDLDFVYQTLGEESKREGNFLLGNPLLLAPEEIRGKGMAGRAGLGRAHAAAIVILEVVNRYDRDDSTSKNKAVYREGESPKQSSKQLQKKIDIDKQTRREKKSVIPKETVSNDITIHNTTNSNEGAKAKIEQHQTQVETKKESKEKVEVPSKEEETSKIFEIEEKGTKEKENEQEVNEEEDYDENWDFEEEEGKAEKEVEKEVEREGQTESRNRRGEIIANYKIISLLGEGAYGEVLKAKKNETNKNDYDVYALKRYRNEENESEEEAAYFLKTQYREINILKKVSGHPNIVNFIDSGKDYEDNLYLVMEYLPYTALNLISSINSISISFNISGKKCQNSDESIASSVNIPLEIIASLSNQLFSALAYLHEKGIYHRDVKPENILLNHIEIPSVCSSTNTAATIMEKNQMKLKLCDFGTARFQVENDIDRLTKYDNNINHNDYRRQNKDLFFTHYVGSRWYRAPELLGCTTKYNESVDVWAAAVLLTEFFLGSPIFQGDTEADVLSSIIKVLGFPPKEYQDIYQRVGTNKQAFSPLSSTKDSLKEILVHNARKIRPKTQDENEFLHFIVDILRWEVDFRLTAKAALNHPYLSQYNNDNHHFLNDEGKTARGPQFSTKAMAENHNDSSSSIIPNPKSSTTTNSRGLSVSSASSSSLSSEQEERQIKEETYFRSAISLPASSSIILKEFQQWDQTKMWKDDKEVIVANANRIFAQVDLLTWVSVEGYNSPSPDVKYFVSSLQKLLYLLMDPYLSFLQQLKSKFKCGGFRHENLKFDPYDSQNRQKQEAGVVRKSLFFLAKAAPEYRLSYFLMDITDTENEKAGTDTEAELNRFSMVIEDIILLLASSEEILEPFSSPSSSSFVHHRVELLNQCLQKMNLFISIEEYAAILSPVCKRHLLQFLMGTYKESKIKPILEKNQLIVARDKVVSDSIIGLVDKPLNRWSNSRLALYYKVAQGDYAKKVVEGIQVEEAEGTGPMKEYFSLLIDQFHEETHSKSKKSSQEEQDNTYQNADNDKGVEPFLAYHQYSEGSWFADRCKINKNLTHRIKQECALFGMIIALALLEGCPLTVNLPDVFFKVLSNMKSYSPCIQDLASLDESLAQQIEKVGSLSQKEFQDLIALEGGKEGRSTDMSRLEYINHYLSSFLPNLTSSSETNGLTQAMESIASGFDKVLGELTHFRNNPHRKNRNSSESESESAEALYKDSEDMNLLSKIIASPLEFNLLVSGQRKQSESQNFEFEEVFILQTESEDLEDSPTLSIFWSVVSSFEPPMKRKLLTFITGSNRLPLRKCEKILIESPFMPFTKKDHATILKTLPQAHTCDNVLELPDYYTSLREVSDHSNEKILLKECKTIIQDSLLFALTGYEGYGLDSSLL